MTRPRLRMNSRPARYPIAALPTAALSTVVLPAAVLPTALPSFAALLISVLATAACLHFAPPTARAQSFDGGIRVNTDAAGSAQGSPWIHAAPDGRVWIAWVNAVDGRGPIVLSSTSDGGATFAPQRVVLPGRTALSGMQRGPQFVVDRRGGIHMVWQERIVQGTVSAMYSRSLDGGQTFSTPVFAAADSGRFDQDFPSIAVDSGDNVSIAWIDNREIELGTSTQTHLYYSRSTDRGATFGAPVRASRMPGGEGGSCECCNTAIATADDGTVFIAFRGNVDNYRDVHVARTSDGGATFEVFQAASGSWQIGACPMTGSSIAVDRNGTAHVVWRDSRQSAGGRDIVYYATLARDGDRCSGDLPISDSPKRTNFPSIAVDRSGVIVTGWQDTRADAVDVHISGSLDGGNTFATSAPVGGAPITGRQELLGLAIAPDGARYAVWQDMRRDAGDIVLARDTAALSTIAPGLVTPSYPLDGATVSSVPALLWSAPANLGSARQVVYSVAITTGTDTLRFDRQAARSLEVSLAPGAHRWWITAVSSVGESTSGPFSFTLSDPSAVEVELSARDVRIHPSPSGSDGAELRFTLTRGTDVSITIHDITGARVETVPSRDLEAGAHSMTIGRGLAAGRYLCRVDIAGHRQVLPLIVR
jgi:hypothetical protein